MSKKSKKPKHHLFGNATLNELFCSSAESSREFCRLAVKTHDEHFGSPVTLMGERECKIISYQSAVMETAFELGWREAMKAMKSELEKRIAL